MAEKEYDFPVFGAQGGGLVKRVGIDQYEFVEAPDPVMNLNVGDSMPSEWGIVPANEQSRRTFASSSDRAEQAEMDYIDGKISQEQLDEILSGTTDL